MGYSTDFTGEFILDQPLTNAQVLYLSKFSETRRMCRDEALTAKRPDPIREAVGLPVGRDGGYFVAEGGWAGQDDGDDVTDYNCEPFDQPGLWCHWVPTNDGEAIEWDGSEKFYNYVEWIEYIIEHFLKRWGRTLNGEVEWSGEDDDDRGKIVIEDNSVTTRVARIVWE